MNIAVTRLKELGVAVEEEPDGYRLRISHDLDGVVYLEVGYLLAQLTTRPFPEIYCPIANVPTQVETTSNKPGVEFRDSNPSYMKFYVYR